MQHGCVLAQHFSPRRSDEIERALDLPQGIGLKSSVTLRRINRAVAQQDLNDLYVVAGFEEMGCEAVSKHMGRHSFLEPCRLGRLMHRVLYRAYAHRPGRIYLRRKEPWWLGIDDPPVLA